MLTRWRPDGFSIPVSPERRLSGRVMLSSNNILSPQRSTNRVPRRHSSRYYYLLATKKVQRRSRWFASLKSAPCAGRQRSHPDSDHFAKGDLIDLTQEHYPQDILRGPWEMCVDRKYPRCRSFQRLIPPGAILHAHLKSLRAVNYSHLRWATR